MMSARLYKYFITVAMLLCTATLSAQLPNIILLVADDLGYGDTGPYGQQKIQTPHLDAMAKEGLRFTQFYAGTSVCAPSRASLMTGLHTGHTPIRGNRGLKPEGQYPLPDSVVTLPTLLQQAGYHTAAFGKWGMGYPGSTGIPGRRGFGEFYGYICQSLAHNYYPDHLWHNEERIELAGNLKADSLYSADHIHQQALAFLVQPHSKPFFLFLPYTLPNGNLQAPHDSVYYRYVQQFGEAPLRQPDKLRAGDRHEPYPHAAFAAMVSRLDQYVGDIRRLLAQKGLDKNTLFLFTSDNGPHREDGGDPAFFNGSGGLSGIKRDLYEGGTRVPAIGCWPGTIKPGTTLQPAAFWDLLPTFCQVAGAKSPAGIDGLSIMPTLLRKGRQQQHEFFYWEFHENNGCMALRMGPWKAVWYNVGLPAPNPIELYNLDKDPAETTNVATANPALVQQMQATMLREHRPMPDWPLLYGEKKVSN